MEAKTREKQMKKHVLVLPFPAQSHINPMLQFSKTLVSNHSTNIKVTLVTTISISKHKNLEPNSSISNLVNIDFISDGFDNEPFASCKPQNNQTYFPTLKAFGSKSLHDLILKYSLTNIPIDCVVYEPFMPWAFDVAKHFGIFAAAFFTQPCLVEYIYFLAYHKMLRLPICSTSLPVEIVGTGLPGLELRDLPMIISSPELYPFNVDMYVNQFSNIHQADYIFFNSFYKLENQVVDLWSQTCPILTVGPTIPSWYLDKHIPNDDSYGLDMLVSDTESESIMDWLKNKQKGSVVYVAFGSLIKLSEKQIEELAWGLKRSDHYYLWATADKEKIPKKIVVGEKGLVVTWTPQLKVLSNEAIGCFLTHCGWNSVIEALSLGVPMVAMPQWSDEPTNAKLIDDVWKVGVRVREVGDEEGGFIVNREEIEGCVREVMEGERGFFVRGNAKKWKEEGLKAVCNGGTSWDNVNVFVSKLMGSRV